jgi:hypothetical protein
MIVENHFTQSFIRIRKSVEFFNKRFFHIISSYKP